MFCEFDAVVNNFFSKKNYFYCKSYILPLESVGRWVQTFLLLAGLIVSWLMAPKLSEYPNHISMYTPCVLGAPYAVFYKITITYQKKNISMLIFVGGFGSACFLSKTPRVHFFLNLWYIIFILELVTLFRNEDYYLYDSSLQGWTQHCHPHEFMPQRRYSTICGNSNHLY